MNFSAYSIKNPLVAILLFTLMTVAGLFAFDKMKVQQFPDIDLPGVITVVSADGVSAAQLENDVAKKIENRLANIDGIKHIRTTIQTGVVTIHSEFTLEKDTQEALDDVRNAVSQTRGELPAVANDPIVAKVSTAGFPVAAFSVSSKSKNDAQLSWWVDDALSRELSDIDGVGGVSRIGGIERQIIVAADANVLSTWRMPITSLSTQIANLWQDGAGGQAQIGGKTQTIRIVGTDDNMHTLKQLPIATPNGTTALKNIAHVYDGHKLITSRAFLDGENVIAFSITRAKGASEVAMIEKVQAKLNEIAAQNSDISIDKIYDNAEPVSEDYASSMRMLIEGCILAVVVVFMFLKDVRATFVAAMALPLSIIPTFLAMHLFGFSLNIISLLALSLVIGVLVDDAIVEIENIMRHLDMGKTPFEAAMEAADEIGLAVIATTFTLIAVFLPTAFMKGVVGQFFSQFGWTAAISIFISLLVARLVTPMMAAYILKPSKPKAYAQSTIMRYYVTVVHWTLKHRAKTLAATFLLFMASLFLVRFLPTSFIPADNTSQTQVTVDLTPDVALMDTEKVALQAARAIWQIDGVQSVFASIGQTGASMDSRSAQAGTPDTAVLNISLKPRGERRDKTAIENDIRKALQNIPSAQFSVGLSSAGESGYSFSLTSSNNALLDKISAQLQQELEKVDGASVSTSKALASPELVVRPDPMLMAKHGISMQALSKTLQVATQGDFELMLPKLSLDTRQLPIVVRLPDDALGDIDALGALYVSPTVQIHQIASLQMDTADSEIVRLDRDRTINFTVNSSRPLGELVAEVKALPTLAHLPSDIGIIEQGQAESMNELFSGFVLAMGVGVFCIFGVLILLFHRILQPLTILVALPLSIGGAFIGLLVTGSDLSMPSMIGFIMLMGIATKNSILLVDYAILAQNAGKSQTLAIIDACQKRARPIIMTTIAMGAGMLPLILGLSGADETFRKPMAAAVLGGLITSTFLSLVVIPVVYTLMDDASAYFMRLRRLNVKGDVIS